MEINSENLQFFVLCVFFLLFLGCESSEQLFPPDENDVEPDLEDVLKFGWDYYFKGDFARAEFMFQKIINAKKDKALTESAYLGLGNINYYKGIASLKLKREKDAEESFKKAINYYSNAYTINKNNPNIYIGMARVYFASARYFINNKNDIKLTREYSEVGLKFLSRLKEFEDLSNDIKCDWYFYEGNFHQYLGNLKEAVASYEKYLTVANKNSSQYSTVQNIIALLKKKINS